MVSNRGPIGEGKADKTREDNEREWRVGEIRNDTRRVEYTYWLIKEDYPVDIGLISRRRRIDSRRYYDYQCE